MKKVLVMLMFIVLAVNVSAIATNITVVSDEVYSGAILKLRSLESGNLGDSYYPFFVGENIGIIKFEVETGLSEVNLSLRFMNNSVLSFQTEEGPWTINGSDIILDFSEVEEIVPISEPVENISIEEVSKNSSKEVDPEVLVEDKPIPVRGGGLVGYVSNSYNVVRNNNYVLMGLGVLFSGIFMFLVVKGAYKKGAEVQLKLLGRMEMDRKIDELDDN